MTGGDGSWGGAVVAVGGSVTIENSLFEENTGEGGPTNDVSVLSACDNLRNSRIRLVVT